MSLEVRSADGVVVIAVSGTLDADCGDELVRATRAWVGDGTTRVEIDLKCLDAFTMEGAAALVACRQLGDRLTGGLHYLTGQGAGREALLAAYAR
jgi:hypothetical protein